MKIHNSKRKSKRYPKHFCKFILLILLFISFVCLIYIVVNRAFGWSFPPLINFVCSIPCQNRSYYLNGISAVITGLGVVGFALSYINSARTTRVKGILLEQVICKCWPFYGLGFLMHGVLSLLGLYSCQVGILDISLVCLIGTLICTSYSLWMAYSINFSRKSRNRLITHYSYALLNKKDFSTEKRQTSYQLGLYIGERFQADDFELSQSSKVAQKNRECLQSTLDLLEPKPSSREHDNPKQVKEPEEEWDGPLPKVFDNLFPTKLAKHPEYSLFTSVSTQECSFKNDICCYATLWNNLLHPVKPEKRRAELVVEILLNAHRTAPLCCGLVYHLHSTQIGFSTGIADWTTCSSFLAQIFNIALTYSNEMYDLNQEKVLRCCMDMTLIFSCLACLQEMNSSSRGLTSLFQTTFGNQNRNISSAICYVPTNPQCITKYLYFANTIIRLLAIPEVDLPFRTQLYRQFPSIIATIDQCFTQRP